MSGRTLLVSLALLSSAALAASAQNLPAGVTKVASVEGITEYRLDNGLRVLLFPDPSRPKVTINLTIFVGSRHEGYGETGMAHLLEHMVFKGTPDHPDIPGAMKERGAQFNGSTWVDRTNYFETLPASDDNLEFAIRLEADRMVNSPIRAEDLATEFSVVRNEFESGENNPLRILQQRMQAAAYEWHNYGKSTIGNRSDIERVPADRLRAFYKKYYRPDNAMLVIAGQFDPDKALRYVARYFGAIPKPDTPLDQTYTEEPPQDGERSVILRRVGEVGLAGLMYHVPSSVHPEAPAIEILTRILADEPSGRLYKALVETKLASDVSAFRFPTKDPGLIGMVAQIQSKDPKAIEAARDAMIDVVENLAQTGITAEEVDRARQQILKDRELAAADPNRIAIELSEWGAQGDWRLYFIWRDRIEKVTPEQVAEVAARYLRPSNRTVGLFFPTDQSDRTPIPPTPDITQLVESYQGRSVSSGGEALDTAPLAIQARVLTPEPIEGIRVALLPKKTRGEVVHLVLNLRYGDAQSLRDYVTAGQLLPDLMLRGTQSLSRQQLQDALDKNFARIAAGGGGSGLNASTGLLSFSVQTKRANLPAVLDLLRQIVREPALSADEFELLRRAELTQAEAALTEPTSLAVNRLARTLSPYPPDDVRYIPTLEESVQRLQSVSIDQIRSLYADFLGASHGELALVGDFDPDEILPLLRPIFQGWTAKQPYTRIERPFQELAQTGRQIIETPDKANAALFAGTLLPIRDSSPDFPALLLGNFVFGGGSLSSRIADRLRQKGGLSYTAASQFNASPLDDRASLIILAIYNPANVDKVVTGVQEELTRLLQDGVGSDELERARKGLLEQFRIRRTNDAALASQLANFLFIGRTFQYEADLEETLQKLSPDQVTAALRRYLDPDRLAIITAGDFTAAAQTTTQAAP
ncbi:MAG: peptidase M16 [Isosphaeraceae bacterium]|nr:MAG: peptidase M16 [Isosphaeraceae bacterium]